MEDGRSDQQSTDQQLSLNEDKINVENKSSETASEEKKEGFFSVTRRYKWIFALSALILIVTSILIYAKYNNVLGAEYWQFYAIIKKSLAALILNLILFFGISLIPAWGLVYMFFKPILELFTGTKLPDWRQPHYW